MDDQASGTTIETQGVPEMQQPVLESTTIKINGCVYFALLVNTFVIKIGFSEHPGDRARGIRAMARSYFGFDPEIEYLALVKGSWELESYYHQKFARFRLANEWFLADSELINYARSQPHVDVREFYKWRQ